MGDIVELNAWRSTRGAYAQGVSLRGTRVPGVSDETSGTDDGETSADVNAAYELAVRSLARCDRTLSELRQYLQHRGYDDDTVESACSRLVTERLYDESRVAENAIRRMQRGGKGDRLIVRELTRRGLPEDIVRAILGHDASAERERATELCRQYVSRHGSADRETTVRRVYGVLQRRGYDGELCRSVVAEVLESLRG